MKLTTKDLKDIWDSQLCAPLSMEMKKKVVMAVNEKLVDWAEKGELIKGLKIYGLTVGQIIELKNFYEAETGEDPVKEL